MGGFALGVATTVATLVTFGPGPWARPLPQLGAAHFQEAFSAIVARYVRPVDESVLWAGAMRGMLSALDPHCQFVSADERKQMRARSDVGSSGLVITRRDDAIEVIAVLPRTPAARAGIAPGDRIVRIDGVAIAAFGSQRAAERALTGPVGRVVRVAFVSDDAEHDVALELDDTPVVNVQSAIVDDAKGRRFVHLVIRRFSGDTAADVDRELNRRRRALGNRLAGIVLDLRSNPGGEIDQAVTIADRFVDSGVLVRTRGRDGKILREESARRADTDRTTPLVVLQDRYTASASELLAVALQDHHRALIVGERSYGKGTVQEVLGLADGSAVSFTIARYHSPDDRVVDGEGVTPNVVAQLARATPAAGVLDDGLRAAIDAFAFLP